MVRDPSIVSPSLTFFICLPLRDAIYALGTAVKREIHAAAERLRHSIISAHANRLHSQGLTWLQASDIANADLYAKGASKRAIGAILARPRGASAREVNLGRLVNTREAGLMRCQSLSPKSSKPPQVTTSSTPPPASVSGAPASPRSAPLPRA